MTPLPESAPAAGADWTELLEQAARSCSDGVQVSIAISLKRIADCLDGTPTSIGAVDRLLYAMGRQP